MGGYTTPQPLAGLKGAIQIELRVDGTTTYRLNGDDRGRVAA